MNKEDNKFPILVQRDSFPGMLSASSAVLDLASLAQTPTRHSNLLQPTTMPCENEFGLSPVIGKGYFGRDFSSLRPPLSTSSKTINGSGVGLSLYKLGEGASLDAGFGSHNCGNLSAPAASNLGFGFDGPDGYSLALGSNDPNVQNLIGIAARHNHHEKNGHTCQASVTG
ncbi:hypothetical protein BY996DRAFT_8685613 [Phakopsora pachyrhizi]|nr:hypothetical protein BY996DRAFT_8685613 [Phakopsora pachyrhizi]